MRIVMLAQFYHPIFNGEIRYIRDLSLELVARGHDVAVATLWQEGLPLFECDQGVRIYRIRSSMQRVDALFRDKAHRHAPPFPDPEVLWGLRRIIIQERPHIVHAHNWIVHSFTPLKTWSKARLVVTLHDCSFVCAKQNLEHQGALCSGPGMMKCLECATHHYGTARGVPITLGHRLGKHIEGQMVDMFLPVSKALVEVTHMDRYNLPYRVIPNFLSDTVDMWPDKNDPLLDQLPRGNYLLFVGDMGRGKGEDVLLRAYAHMEHQMPLVFIGRSVTDFLAHCPPHVKVLSEWPHSSIMQAWSRCAIAVIPSTAFDSCPTVTLEAMAMGRPVVASRIGGLSEIVRDGETGLLVDPGNEHALHQAIEHLVAHPALRERMGASAKQRVMQFQASSVIPQIEQVYQEVMHI